MTVGVLPFAPPTSASFPRAFFTSGNANSNAVVGEPSFQPVVPPPRSRASFSRRGVRPHTSDSLSTVCMSATSSSSSALPPCSAISGAPPLQSPRTTASAPPAHNEQHLSAPHEGQYVLRPRRGFERYPRVADHHSEHRSGSPSGSMSPSGGGNDSFLRGAPRMRLGAGSVPASSHRPQTSPFSLENRVRQRKLDPLHFPSKESTHSHCSQTSDSTCDDFPSPSAGQRDLSGVSSEEESSGLSFCGLTSDSSSGLSKQWVLDVIQQEELATLKEFADMLTSDELDRQTTYIAEDSFAPDGVRMLSEDIAGPEVLRFKALRLSQAIKRMRRKIWVSTTLRRCNNPHDELGPCTIGGTPPSIGSRFSLMA